MKGGVDISQADCEGTDGTRIGQCVTICFPCDSAHIPAPLFVHRFLLAIALFALPLAPVSAQEAAAQLVLQSGDAVQVKIWREPGLSGEFGVNDRGEVVFPLIGTRNVTGQPWAQVRDTLLAAFRRELRDPDVGLVPLRRVYVLGSVDKPGIFFADPLGTFAQAIAMAGGATTEGDPTHIRVVRGGTTVVPRIALDAVMSATDLRSGDQIFVERRSWFDRNSAAVVGAGAGLLGVIATLILIR
jgi:protein involved in polysaccharide export with SLBB domain